MDNHTLAIARKHPLLKEWMAASGMGIKCRLHKAARVLHPALETSVGKPDLPQSCSSEASPQ